MDQALDYMSSPTAAAAVFGRLLCKDGLGTIDGRELHADALTLDDQDHVDGHHEDGKHENVDKDHEETRKRF